MFQKNSIYRKINRNLPKQINSLDELDLESPYTQTKNDKQFLIYKSEKIAIFQSELQSKLMFENYSDILIDGTFFSVPKCVYQIIITRFALEYHHKYFTTSFTLSSNKKEDTYKEIFKIINNNIKEYQLKNKLKINFRPKNIHCDMEIVLINAIQFIWPYSNVKICYFHWNQAMEKNRKKYKDIFENNVSNNEAFKCLLTLPLIQEDVVESVFNELKSNNLCLELKELFDYYEKMFIIKF